MPKSSHLGQCCGNGIYLKAPYGSAELVKKQSEFRDRLLELVTAPRQLHLGMNSGQLVSLGTRCAGDVIRDARRSVVVDYDDLKPHTRSLVDLYERISTGGIWIDRPELLSNPADREHVRAVAQARRPRRTQNRRRKLSDAVLSHASKTKPSK